MTNNTIATFLWFHANANEAARHYVEIFPDAKILDTSPMGTTLELAGQRYICFNGGEPYKLTPAVSIMVTVKTQAEIDQLWDRFISAGGSPSKCGWLVDKFGLSWQIVPANLRELLATPSGVQAMLKMQKLDIAELERASRS